MNISRNADFHPPLIERVRKDWRHVQLEKIAPKEPWLRVIGHGFGLAVVLAFVILVVMR